MDGRDTCGGAGPLAPGAAGRHRIGLRIADGTTHELDVTVEPVRDFRRSGASSGSLELPDLLEP